MASRGEQQKKGCGGRRQFVQILTDDTTVVALYRATELIFSTIHRKIKEKKYLKRSAMILEYYSSQYSRKRSGS